MLRVWDASGQTVSRKSILLLQRVCRAMDVEGGGGKLGENPMNARRPT